MYRYISRESCSQFDSLPLTSLTLFVSFQIIVDYKHGELDLVLKALNTMPNHLTAGVVSNDIQFNNKVLGETITGTMCVLRSLPLRRVHLSPSIVTTSMLRVSDSIACAPHRFPLVHATHHSAPRACALPPSLPQVRWYSGAHDRSAAAALVRPER